MQSFKKFLNAKTYTPEFIAKKHGVEVSHIESQLTKGIEVEKEHTSHENIAREIALDHLHEDPNYYTKLDKMESKS